MTVQPIRPPADSREEVTVPDNNNGRRFHTIGGNGGNGKDCLPCPMEGRIRNLEDNDGVILREISHIRSTLGDPPDVTTGKPGSGLSRTLYQVANAVIRDRMPSSPSIDPAPTSDMLDYDEGEVTKIQSRTELVSRARAAEAALAAHREAVKVQETSKIEAGKLKVEKWKIIVGVLGVLLGPGFVTVVVQLALQVWGK